jgi:WD40 repeat protein
MRTSFKSMVVAGAFVLSMILLGWPIRVSPLSAQDVGSIKNTATLNGHSEAVTCVAFSPDGKTLASGSHDKTVMLWDVASGKNTATFKGHPGQVTFVAFSPDGKTIISACPSAEKGAILLWDVATGKNTTTLSPGLLLSVTLRPDGKAVATGHYKEVKLWDLPRGKNTATFKGHTNTVDAVQFSPDGQTLASVSEDGLKLWDVKSGKSTAGFRRLPPVVFSPDGKLLASAGSLLTISDGKDVPLAGPGHKDNVLCLAFSADGRLFASGSSDQTAIVWDVPSGKSIATLKGHTSSVNGVAFSPDGKLLASASGDKTIKLWSISEGSNPKEPQQSPDPESKDPKARATLGAGHTSLVLCAAYSPNGKLLASSGFKEKVIKLWEVSSGRHVGTLTGHKEDVRQLAFSPDSSVLASASADKTLKLWDVSAKKELTTLSGHTGEVDAVCFSPDGKLLASGSQDKTARLWDVAGKKEAGPVAKHTSFVKGVCFSPDGTTLASCGWDGNVILRDVKTGKEKATLTGKDCFFNCVAFSPDGATLAAGTAELKKPNKSTEPTGEVVLWEMPGGKEIARLVGHQRTVATVSFKSDGTLASADEGTVKLWKAKKGEEAATHDRAGRFGVFSPDGKTLATTYDGFGLRLIDVTSGKDQPPFQDFTIRPLRVAFSPKGDLLAAADQETVRLWDTKTGKLVRILQGHGGRQQEVSFSPDGKALAAVGGHVTLWDVSSGEKATTLKADDDWLDSLAFHPSGKYLVTAGTALGGRKILRTWNYVAGLEFSSDKRELKFKLGPVAYGTEGKFLAFVESKNFAGDSQVVLWDTINRKEQSVLKAKHLSSVAVSRDGSMVAAGGGDAIIGWHRATGKELFTLKVPDGQIHSVCFNPDGTLLASGGRDKTVRIWNVKEKKEIAVLRGHSDNVGSVQFSPDGRTLASGSFDGSVKLWDVPESPAQAPKKDDPPKTFTNSIGMKFVWIPPGTYMMGSPKSEAGRKENEAQHKVTLTKGFYMGVYTVTQEQWEAIMGDNPSHMGQSRLNLEKNLPVEKVSWEDCQAFLKKLREKDKKPYRLPTEAEWEYACRAGTTTPFHFGETISTDQANYCGDFIYGKGKKGVDRKTTTPVGSFPANAFGLHDMHGNVWQWCQDWYGDYPQKDVGDPQGPESGKFRVLRGGSWGSGPDRSAQRYAMVPTHRDEYCGLRICFTPE